MHLEPATSGPGIFLNELSSLNDARTDEERGQGGPDRLAYFVRSVEDMRSTSHSYPLALVIIQKLG